MRRHFLTDTEGIDTIPLKMIVYLAITGCVLVLIAMSWNAIVPLKQGCDVEKQLSEASLELLSLQKGKARDLSLISSAEGSMCSLDLDFPKEITYLGFGVDPDPDNDGNITNSGWDTENNTIIYRYDNGVKKRWVIKGEQIHFCQGHLSADGTWLPESTTGHSNMGVVIEKPISGTYVFELARNNTTFTLSHFS